MTVGPDLLLILPHRAHTIAPTPQMTPPVPLAQPLIATKQAQRQLPLQKPHHGRDRVLRRNRHHHVNMILLHVDLQHLNKVLLAAEHLDLLPGVACNVVLEDPKAILRTEDDVVFALIDRMR